MKLNLLNLDLNLNSSNCGTQPASLFCSSFEVSALFGFIETKEHLLVPGTYEDILTHDATFFFTYTSLQLEFSPAMAARKPSCECNTLHEI